MSKAAAQRQQGWYHKVGLRRIERKPTALLTVKVESYPAGYPQYSALVSSYDSFFIFRSFQRLRARLLLTKQDELHVLEMQLENIDKTEISPFFLGTCRGDRNAAREILLDKIQKKLTEYDSFVGQCRHTLSYNRASSRDLASLRNWLEEMGCISDDEASYLKEENDLISLAISGDHAMKQLEDWIEDCLIHYYSGFRQRPGFETMMELILAGATFATVLTTAAARQNTIAAVLDLPNDVPAARQTLRAAQPDDPSRLIYMDNLAVQLANRYQSSGATADFEEASQIARQLVALAEPNHPHRAQFLQNLAFLLEYRYNRTRQLVHLNEAIQHTRMSLDTPSQSPTERTLSLNHLSRCLEHRFRGEGAICDIQEATQVTRQSLEGFQHDDPQKSSRIGRLAILLFAQYDAMQATETLGEAMFIGFEVVDKLPRGQDRISLLMCLGKACHDEYRATGNMAALESALKLYQDCEDSTKSNCPESTSQSYFLGLVYLDRFRRTHATKDLDAAMKSASAAVYCTPDDHPNKHERLAGLGAVYHERYRRTENPDDLETATKMYQAAVDIAQREHLDIAGYLCLLGSAHVDRYRAGAPGSSLELPLRLAEEAVRITPACHPDRASRLEALGTVYKVKSQDRASSPEDSSRTIQLFEESLSATPKNHPERASRLRLLGVQYEDRHGNFGSAGDLETAIGLYREALENVSSTSHIRMLAGRDLTSIFVHQGQWQHAHEAAHTVIQLMPSLAPASLGPADQKFLLSHFSNFASDAAAIALTAGKPPFDALQLLELGRGVLSGSLSRLYLDVSELSEKHPGLATRYTELRDEVDRRAKSAEIPRPKGLLTPRRPGQMFTTRESEADRTYNAGRDLENLVAEIRNLTGFQDFLLPPSKSIVKAAASRGPIIIINTSTHRCDALLITPDSITSLQLPHLHKADIETRIRTNNTGTLLTLSWLWHTTANPILTALNYTSLPSSPTAWPRVWWILTGPLSRFPLHAAGIYTDPFSPKGTTDTVLDRVISSYSTTVQALLHTRSLRTSPLSSTTTKSKAILLAMHKTPNLRTLPHAKPEIAAVRALFPSHIHPIEPLPLKEAVMSELLSSPCAIFHFAGHGKTDETDALRSYLVLGQDGKWNRDERLTVRDLYNLNLRQGKAPSLAYLSACGTGGVGEMGVVGEGVHLVGAFQAVGFRHVVGTLWEVSDEVCVDIARAFYEGLGREGWRVDGDDDDDDGEAVSRALHWAIRAAREQTVGRMDGTRKVVFCEEEEEEGTGELLWVPYVHFGG
ncbi:hypothetical protein OQA88_824 [Cercophora sp. LCS_1]